MVYCCKELIISSSYTVGEALPVQTAHQRLAQSLNCLTLGW